MADSLASILRSGTPQGGDELDVGAIRRRERFMQLFGVDPEAENFQSQVLGNFAAEAAPQVAFGALPIAGRGLAAMLRAAPRASAGVAAAGGSALAATEASPQGASTNPASLETLYAQRGTLQRQAEDARARREKERKTGPGPRYDEADAEFKRLSDRLTGLDGLIKGETDRNSPAAQLAARQAELLAQEENRKRDANTPFKERTPGIAAAIPYISGAAAFGLGALTKGRNISTYNKQINDLSSRWQSAVQRAQGSADPAARVPATMEAEGLGRQFTRLQAAGPSSRGTVAPAAAAGEAGQMYPVVSDYARAQPGSELEKKTLATMTDPVGMAGRVIQGFGWGYLPAKIGAGAASAIRGKSVPPGFSAETTALRPPGALPLTPEEPATLARLLRTVRPNSEPPTIPPSGPPQISGSPPQALLPAPAGAPSPSATPSSPPSTAPSSTQSLSSLLTSPANSNAQNVGPAPPHFWDGAVGRWRGEGGRFVPGRKK